MSFRNFPIARKLAVGFGSVLMIVAISSVFVFIQTRNVSEIERLNSVSDNAVDFIDQAWGDLNEVKANVFRSILSGVSARDTHVADSLAEMHKDLDAAKDILAKEGPELLPVATAYEAALAAYFDAVIKPEMEMAADPAKRQQAVDMVMSDKAQTFRVAADQAFNVLRAKVDEWSSTYTEAGNNAMHQIEWTVALSGGLSILLGIGMAWIIVRAIGRPLGAMTGAMRRLAAGETSIEVPALDQTDEIGQMAAAVQVFKEAGLEKLRLEATSQDLQRRSTEDRNRADADRASTSKEQAQVVEALALGLQNLSDGALTFRLSQAFGASYDQLRMNFNAAMDKLQETIKVVATNSSAIRSGSDEISSAADDLSRRTEQQAASLEETAAALDQITATVRKTADGSKHARDVVSLAKQAAEQSGDVVRQAVDAMSQIEKSSGQISNIIGVIDEIAFQTNLLALNAGVEAARAGEAGRGFAVVASEVRALAQRSADAAKEIKTLISASSSQVEHGVTLVGETGRALEKIVAQVGEINGIVGDIAASAHEQATGLDQVNTAVNQMDQVTQQNAAMVEETTAASHALVKETAELSRVISRFDIGETQAAGASRPGAKSGRPAPRPVASRPAVAMKVTGSGGAARKPEAAADESWQEF